MAKRESKPRGTCIFCGSGGVTKEHVWSDWLSDLIPARTAHRQGTSEFDFDRNTGKFRVTRPTTYKQKRGCVTQTKIRKVCGSCNSGWMSRAVEAAKPVAENLAQGVGGRYHENNLTKLVPWLSITITMQEFISQPETSVIQPEERQTLKETNLPPPDWTIWIGYYGGIKWHPINHARYSATLENRLTTSAGIYPPFPSQRIQVATFTLLHLAVHAFNATAIGLVSEYRQFVKDMKWNLFQIWPTVPVGLTWPRLPILDAEMHEIVTRFGHDRNGHRDMDFQLGR